MENNQEQQEPFQEIDKPVGDISNIPNMEGVQNRKNINALQTISALSKAAQAIEERQNILKAIQPNSSVIKVAQGLQEHRNALKHANPLSLSILKASHALQQHQNIIKNAIQPNLSLQNALRNFQDQQSIAKNALQPHAYSSSIHEALKSFRGYQDSIRDTHSQFILPDIPKIYSLFNSIKPDPTFLGLSSNLDQISRAAASMHNPWLNSLNTAASLKAFSELQSIGGILKNALPFSDDLVNPIRASLGDWRNTIEWPKNIFTSLEAKSNFYQDLGYDQDLVDFPDPAFDETLEVAGIGQSVPTLIDLYGDPIPPSGNADEENGFKRTNKAHDLLSRLESHIRRFILVKMTEAFGQNWAKQQIPDQLLKAWKEKRDTYQKSHPNSEEMDIIKFADFSDYVQIIIRNDNWNKVFKPYFQRKENVTESFQRLFPIRIDTMHARLISRSDELLLLVETERLYKACKI